MALVWGHKARWSCLFLYMKIWYIVESKGSVIVDVEWWLLFFSCLPCSSAEVPPRGFRYHCQAASEYQWRKRMVCKVVQFYTEFIWSGSKCSVSLQFLLLGACRILKTLKEWQSSLLQSPFLCFLYPWMPEHFSQNGFFNGRVICTLSSYFNWKITAECS